MTADAEDTGFLSRWSRRKAQVREGSTAPAALAISASAAPVMAPKTEATIVPQAAPAVLPAQPASPVETEAPLTLADVAALTRDSDYSRFMASSVQPDVKRAALARLFTDPHFNVMDGLDVYIDDYGKPDPLPAGMLRQMFQSQMLGLFDDEKTDAPNVAHAGDGAAAATDPVTAETEPPADPPVALTADPTDRPFPDENTDLQLQPDDDAGRPGDRAGAGQDTRRAH